MYDILVSGGYALAVVLGLVAVYYLCRPVRPVASRCPATQGISMSESLKIGGMTAEELEESLDREKIHVSSYSRSMFKNKKQFIQPVNEREKERRGETETLALVRLQVRDLGFTSPPTTKELFARARERGLELCPPETGPYLRLKDKDQPSGWYFIGMEPVADSVGHPRVFFLARLESELWLGSYWASPDILWHLDYQFVFRVRKSDS